MLSPSAFEAQKYACTFRFYAQSYYITDVSTEFKPFTPGRNNNVHLVKFRLPWLLPYFILQLASNTSREYPRYGPDFLRLFHRVRRSRLNLRYNRMSATQQSLGSFRLVFLRSTESDSCASRISLGTYSMSLSTAHNQ